MPTLYELNGISLDVSNLTGSTTYYFDAALSFEAPTDGAIFSYTTSGSGSSTLFHVEGDMSVVSLSGGHLDVSVNLGSTNAVFWHVSWGEGETDLLAILQPWPLSYEVYLFALNGAPIDSIDTTSELLPLVQGLQNPTTITSGPLAPGQPIDINGLGVFRTSVVADPENLVILGTEGNDMLDGGEGHDTIAGFEGDDTLDGGVGDDVLLGDNLSPLYETDVSGQVFRLYQATLGRAPDDSGHRNWMQHLLTGEISLEQAAAGFVGSVEFQNTFSSLDNSGFVELLYQNVLGRAADANGLANWTARLADGASRASVVLGFSESAEFKNNTAAAATTFANQHDHARWQDNVYRLYLATLGREPDATGFVNWGAALGSGTDQETVASGFVNSAEFQNTYGSLNNSEFVELLYQNVLGRASDAAGKQRWLDSLSEGASRSAVVLGFANSAEFIASTSDDLVAWVRGLGVNDQLDGGAGDNILAGGILSDQFVFDWSANGDNQILDLEAWDILDVSSLVYSSADDVRNQMVQSGDDVVFNGFGFTVRIMDTQLSEISDEMILY